MKQSKFIVILALAMVATGTFARASAPVDQKEDVQIDDQRLQEVGDLLERLDQLGALDISYTGEVKIKKSFIDQLKASGRTSSKPITPSSMCDGTK